MPTLCRVLGLRLSLSSVHLATPRPLVVSSWHLGDPAYRTAAETHSLTAKVHRSYLFTGQSQRRDETDHRKDPLTLVSLPLSPSLYLYLSPTSYCLSILITQPLTQLDWTAPHNVVHCAMQDYLQPADGEARAAEQPDA
ncbi:hypothetical protein F4780DRAFT_545712 [Xylariomycetidae sp. FL0641]|nr:hypothetical protein F4780DRAFT_545712 [Xylariomycetidae sp. FL0641]